MEIITFQFKTRGPAKGAVQSALVGVVASGNLEILLERVLGSDECIVEVSTPVRGFGDVWKAVITDFVEATSPGSLKISINDSGARPDTVTLRLKQGLRTLEITHE